MVTKDKPGTKQEIAEYHVFDTWVDGKNGEAIHFDVCTAVKNGKKAIEFAKEYLKSIGQEGAKVTSEECGFCHSDEPDKAQAKKLNEKGYFIIRM
ncbi:MAG: DUF2024 family protein [Candidatus Micrarchaeaceae archaeon]